MRYKVELKNKNIINKMTLKEKALLLSGKGMWKTYDFEAYGIPAFLCQMVLMV